MCKTLKEITAKAQGLMAEGMKGWSVDDALMDFMNEQEMRTFSNMVYLDDNYEYIADVNFTDDYHFEAEVYDYEEWRKFESAYDKWYHEHGHDINDLTPAPEIEAKFKVMVPETRGYSDTPKRSDTQLSDLDMRIAIDEAVTKHLNKPGKLQPWMLRGLICASELGIEEEELEYELEELCAV